MSHLTSRFAIVVLFLMCSPVVLAADKVKGKPANKASSSEPKTVSGMSIMGNNEAPKSLYIVPWKSSEMGGDTKLTSGLLNDSTTTVDRDVFKRELDFYEFSKGN